MLSLSGKGGSTCAQVAGLPRCRKPDRFTGTTGRFRNGPLEVYPGLWLLVRSFAGRHAIVRSTHRSRSGTTESRGCPVLYDDESFFFNKNSFRRWMRWWWRREGGEEGPARAEGRRELAAAALVDRHPLPGPLGASARLLVELGPVGRKTPNLVFLPVQSRSRTVSGLRLALATEQ